MIYNWKGDNMIPNDKQELTALDKLLLEKELNQYVAIQIVNHGLSTVEYTIYSPQYDYKYSIVR